ncbi:MAG: SusD/RagB family nutrient-binding outer membrane lipoprotein [Crocinitomicaceae bacterium]
MKNLHAISILLIALTFFACKKDFELINTNPNFPIEVEPNLLLRQVIYDYGEQMSYEGFVAGNLLGQYMTMVDFNLFDRHGLTQPQLGGNPWPILYKNLRDNDVILAKSQSEAIYKVYEGPSRILKALITQVLTDIYGDVPYSEALQGLSGNVTPKYDKQEQIYTGTDGILDQLNKAIAAIDGYTGVQTLQGDILYAGNLQKWKKLANSIKIKALMRISDRDNEIALDVAQELQNVLNDGNFINSNSDNAYFQFSSIQPNSFRMQKLRAGDFNLYVMSQTSDTLLQKFNDPRREIFFRPTGNNASQYNGLINGINASTTSITLGNYSLAGTIFRENTGALKCNFMTAWETQFFLAEAAQKGYIAGSAQTFYESGVANAFDFWNVAMPSAYLTVGNAAFSSGDPIEQILTQKWLANTINGYESWIEYRRTGFPQLLPVAASLNGGLYPVRMPYPTDEAALNPNASNAFAATGGNGFNTKVWWDKF